MPRAALAEAQLMTSIIRNFEFILVVRGRGIPATRHPASNRALGPRGTWGVVRLMSHRHAHPTHSNGAHNTHFASLASDWLLQISLASMASRREGRWGRGGG